ncbi:MAG: hypothetical protein HQ515_06510 [Phycisphaeraceae bacterium]|nr:hypothetical protein [Phycisphaeraceae bacterium]
MFDKLFDPGVLAIVFMFGAPVFAVVGYFTHQIIKLRADNELKRVMVEKGLGAEEIERILAASSKQKDDPDKPDM